jgi:hypothetical protein
MNEDFSFRGTGRKVANSGSTGIKPNGDSSLINSRAIAMSFAESYSNDYFTDKEYPYELRKYKDTGRRTTAYS